MRNFPGIAVALALCACGPPSAEQPKIRCAGSLKGGLERSFGNCSFSQIYRQNLDTLLLTTNYDELTEGGGAAYTLASHIEQPGEPRDGLTTTSNLSCDLSVTSNPQVWIAQQRPGVLGTCRLSISEAVAYKQIGNVITYCILRGVLEATLEADPSTPRRDPVPAIALSVTFDVAPNTDDPIKQREICARQK